MQTLKPVDTKIAAGETAELFNAIEQRLKRVPNMIQVMGNSPAVLEAYLHFNDAFDKAKMAPRLRGLISAAVSEINGCDYTLSAAFALGGQDGLDDDEWTAARRAEAGDPRSALALRFASKIVRERGRVPAADIEELHKNGFDDEEVVEIIALVTLNIFRNYFNLVAKTEVDFPLVKTHYAAREATAA